MGGQGPWPSGPRASAASGWKSWKLIAQTISPIPSIFIAQRSSTYSRGNMVEFGETRGGVAKSGVLEQKSGNIFETRKNRGKVIWRTYRKSQTLFRKVPSPTPYGLPFPNIGGLQPHTKTAIAIISGTAKATDCKFGRYIHRVHPNTSP